MKNWEQSSYRPDKDRRLRRQLTLAMKRAGEADPSLEMKRSGGSPRPDWRHQQKTHGALSPVLPPTPILPNITQTKDDVH